MILLEFLGYLAALTFLTLVIVVCKNAVDAELTRMTIQKKVKKAIRENLYLVIKGNESIRKDLEGIGLLDSDDIDNIMDYLRSIPKEELAKELDATYNGQLPFTIDELLEDEENDK